jgi:DNA-binding transcriptional LysR family regulator
MDMPMQLAEIWRRMKLHDLRVLMAVDQTGSMSKAAQLLNTTQSAISRSIADLEQTIGVVLFDRGRHGAQPTEYGRALLNGGVAMFDELRQAVKNIEFLADPTVGEVKVGATDPVIVSLLPAIFARLHRQYPRISIHVTTTRGGPQQYRDLRNRQVDLFFGRVLQPIAEDLHAETLFDDQLLVVAGQNNKWTRQRKVELSELANATWCLPAPDSTLGALVASAFREHGMKFPPEGVMWGTVSLLGALITRGSFLGTVPASLLRFGTNLPRLKILPVELPIPRWPVGIITLRSRTLTPVVKVFIERAREVVSPLISKK